TPWKRPKTIPGSIWKSQPMAVMLDSGAGTTSPIPKKGPWSSLNPSNPPGGMEFSTFKTKKTRMVSHQFPILVNLFYTENINRPLKMKKIILVLALGAFLGSCGGKKEEKKEGFEVSRTKSAEQKSDQGEGVPVDLDNKGVGPIKNLELPSTI